MGYYILIFYYGDIMFSETIYESCAKCAAKKYTSICGVKRRCLLKNKTKIIDGRQIPLEPCYKPTTKKELYIEFRYCSELSEKNKKKFIKAIEAHKSWTLNIPEVNITCNKCEKVFTARMRNTGWFPKMRKCTHCGTKNYIT
jgi:hypothetical protein